MRDHSTLLAVTLAYVLGSPILGAWVGWAPPTSVVLSLLSGWGLSVGILAVALFRVRLARERSRPAASGVWAGWLDAWRVARTPGSGFLAFPRFEGALLVCLLLPCFSLVFSAWKTSIPRLAPFTWDARLAAFDRMLHGGVTPGAVTHAILGELATRVLDLAYLPVWAALQIIGYPLVAAAAPSPARQRFLVCYALTWIVLGNVAAQAFASVGPCFLAPLGIAPDVASEFSPFLARLDGWHAEIRLLNVRAQRLLLQMSGGDTSTVGSGLSAMPSLHVATAVLFACYGWTRSRRLGAALTAFAVVIQVGSVHLGWHYAVDGYASAVVVLALWWCSGRWSPRSAPLASSGQDIRSVAGPVVRTEAARVHRAPRART